ncbi:MAG TPA: NAD(P)H-dependent oxidoreductase [Pseudonocardia sp.]|jgi:chromate reductase|nr:NAD(P)H-dependent oxidoreductase [Pseudonocardia sp.]
MRILGIAGSLRAASFNRRLLRQSARLLPDGVQWEVWDGLATIPPFNEDHEADPGPAVEQFRAAISRADRVLIATPEYNGGIPGQLKNALDWASRPAGHGALAGKLVAVIGASPGRYGASRSQAQLRDVLRNSRAQVVEAGLAVPTAHEQFDDEGHLTDPALISQLGEVLRALVAGEVPAVTPG